jgi:hypothetical protein
MAFIMHANTFGTGGGFVSAFSISLPFGESTLNGLLRQQIVPWCLLTEKKGADVGLGHGFCSDVGWLENPPCVLCRLASVQKPKGASAKKEKFGAKRARCVSYSHRVLRKKFN